LDVRLPIAGLALCAVLFSLCACDRQDAGSYVASAKDRLQKNETRAAVIQLKNALQKQPDSAEATLLLGESLLKLGDAGAGAATIELKKAVALKAPEARVLPLLARSLNLEGRADETIERFARTQLADPAAAADLKTSLAAAYLAQGKASEAGSALNDALTLAPNSVDAQILQTRLLLARHDVDGAASAADKLVRAAPNRADAWQLLGDVRGFARGDTDGALEAYRKALALRPELLPPRVGVLSLLLAKKDLAGFETELAALKKLAPEHPQTQYFEARLAYVRRDYKTAGDLAQHLLAKAPEDVHVLKLAGAIDLAAGQLAQAERSLARAVQITPDDPALRQLLAQAYMRLSEPSEALSTLAPLIDKGSPDASALILAAQVHYRMRDSAKAEALLVRAAEADPSDMRSRTALALAQIGKGNAEAAFDELHEISAASTDSTADLAMIGAMLQRRDTDGALAAVAALERKQPSDALAPALRGRILASRKQLPEARASFERALALDPAYFQASVGIAALDYLDGHPDLARKRFEAVLARDPKNFQAVQALADLKEAAGTGANEVGALYANAVKLAPNDPAPRLALIGFHLKHKDYKHALAAAQDGVAVLPDNPRMIEALGRVQQASGDLNQALATFNRLVALQPGSADPQIRLAEVYTAMKSDEQAAAALRRALAASPDALAAQRRLIALEAQRGRVDAALAVAKTVQTQRPNEAAGYLFEGDLQASRKNWDGALTALRQGLKNAPGSDVAIRLHAALAAAGKQSDADAFASEWTKGHAQDILFLTYLGDAAIQRNDYAAAESRYRSVLQIQPDNAVALNNVAWLLSTLNRPGALAYAERAARLQPDRPEFMDTQAAILMHDKQFDKALTLQKRAVALQPDNDAYRLNLARAYALAGAKPEARAELERLNKLGSRFPQHDEVAQLLATL
jgi:putative PEP-CTERM system TPR-repeat lipoprotein